MPLRPGPGRFPSHGIFGEAGPMTILRSYTGGQWRTPAGQGVQLFDAVTGGEVARGSSEGVDMAAALNYGRAVGGPGLRRATLPRRGALLEAPRSQLCRH